MRSFLGLVKFTFFLHLHLICLGRSPKRLGESSQFTLQVRSFFGPFKSLLGLLGTSAEAYSLTNPPPLSEPGQHRSHQRLSARRILWWEVGTPPDHPGRLPALRPGLAHHGSLPQPPRPPGRESHLWQLWPPGRPQQFPPGGSVQRAQTQGQCSPLLYIGPAHTRLGSHWSRGS